MVLSIPDLNWMVIPPYINAQNREIAIHSALRSG